MIVTSQSLLPTRCSVAQGGGRKGETNRQACSAVLKAGIAERTQLLGQHLVQRLTISISNCALSRCASIASRACSASLRACSSSERLRTLCPQTTCHLADGLVDAYSAVVSVTKWSSLRRCAQNFR